MELLTPDELADWLHLSRRSVYELCSVRGQQRQKTPLPFLKIAGKLRFSREAVQQWLLRLQGVNPDAA
jgi:excisionase family DNA binding protein